MGCHRQVLRRVLNRVIERPEIHIKFKSCERQRLGLELKSVHLGRRASLINAPVLLDYGLLQIVVLAKEVIGVYPQLMR